MNLPTIPHDKALHMIYGGAVAAAAATLSIIGGVPQFAPWAAYGTSFVAGVIKEALDYRDNLQLPGSHVVETADVIATAAGGAIVALPLLFLFLLS